MASIIRFAYGMEDGLASVFSAHPFGELVGEPQWVERYDIEGKTAGSVGTLRRGVVGPIHFMLQSLLAERFKLAVHWEKAERDVYALVRKDGNAPLGAGIKPTESPACPTYFTEQQKARAEGTSLPAAPARRYQSAPACGTFGTSDLMQINGSPMKELADALATRLRHPVIDETGLTGLFDVELTFPRARSSGTPDQAQSIPNAPALGDRLSVPDAVRDQLNLRLERRRGTVDVLVIDHVERPTEN